MVAAFEGVPGIEVAVHQNGVAMKEYDDNEDEGDIDDELKLYQHSVTVSKFIESHAGQEFSVELAVTPAYKQLKKGALAFEIFVDGRQAENLLLRKAEFNTRTGWTKSIEGLISHNYGRDWEVQKFKFAAIETTTEEQHSVEADTAHVEKIGEIAVWVYRDSYPRKKAAKVLNAKRKEPNIKHDGVVHEQAMKGQAKSHGAILSNAQEAEAAQYYNSKRLDPEGNVCEGKPIVIYRFKYRSLENLQSLLIVPREEEGARDVGTALNDNQYRPSLDAATPEEKQWLEDQLVMRRNGGSFPQLKKEERGIKREGTGAEGSRKRVKLEPYMNDRTRNEKGALKADKDHPIDLTDD